jgi:hypothetical protein
VLNFFNAMATTVLSEQEMAQVNDLASRLRRIQMDAATAPPEKRRDLLQEELARSLKGAAPASRQSQLKVLLTRFPVAGQILRMAPVAAPPAPPAPPPAPPTLDQLLEQFLTAAAGIPVAKRTEISSRLAKAGLGSADGPAAGLEVGAELRDKFGLGSNQQPQAQRIVELAAQLTELCAKLDQATFNTWIALSRSNPSVRRHQDLRVAVARRLAGEGEELDPRLQAISALVGGLQVALLKGGKEFERYYTERFAPQAINDVVEGEGGGGLFKNKKERCWDKYCERAKDFAAPGVIEKHLNDSFVKQVENVVRANR